MKSYFFVISCVSFLSFLFFVQPVSADLGPKPTMYFNLKYEISKDIKLEECKQYQCDKPDCSDAAVLERLGPQGTTSLERACQSVAYGYAPYQKLVLKFSDKTRESNVFKADKSKLDSDYDVIVKEDGLVIGDGDAGVPITVYRTFGYFFVSFIITLFLELLTAVLFLFALKLKRKILLTIFIGNILTLPFVWFIFPLLLADIPWVIVMLVSEFFAVTVEALLIYFLNTKLITLVKSIALSVLINIVSLFVGGFILQLLTK